MKYALNLLCAGMLCCLPVMADAEEAAGHSPSRTLMVSIPPQKFLAQSIGGALVEVRVMLEPGYAPETYEPTPAQLAHLAGAGLYFSIGVPFESAWLPEIARQNSELQIVECCAGLAAAHKDSDGHDDPHVWVDPLQFLRAAQLIHAALVQRDVGNRRLYDGNYRKLSEELIRVHRDLRHLLKDRRIDEFIISHGALGPLADAYGLKQVALDTGGRELGPKALAGVVDLARRQNIRIVFVQKQHGRGPAEALAREIGAELVEIDPLAENYLDNMRTMGRLLAMATR